MEFCSCENMYYISNNKENDLVYHCKFCDNTKIIKKENGSICVINDNKIDDVIKYAQYNTKYIKNDVTLPRVNNIPCTNINCTKSEKQENEVIYVKYDFNNMKYLYFCTYCDTCWKLN